jgi:putative tricarboxylic transport membrane protein
MKQLSKLALLPGLFAFLTITSTIPNTATAAAWEPQKPVDFVVMAGPGGGADKMARLMQTIIQKHKMSPEPFIPVNKPGGSGAEALIYLKQNKGDNHIVMVTLNSFYTTPLRQPGLHVNSLDFTPVARMAEDTFILWVNKDSGIKNLDEFVAAAKKKGDDWIMAGTGKGQEDELLTNYLNTTFGLKMRYVPYKGGGRVAKELAGNQANSTVNNPSEALGFYQAGVVVPIVAFTAERLPMFPDVPTLKELGHDFTYYMQRSVVGPPGMSDAAAEYYRTLFKKVYDSEEWQKYMKNKSLLGKFMTDGELEEYWKAQIANHKKMLEEIGEIKVGKTN